MNDYAQVLKQLDAGVKPDLLCASCPWDRLCIKPPTMTHAEAEAKLKEVPVVGPGASERDRQIAFGTLMVNALAYAGKAQQSEVCPVFALRMRSEEGRDINSLVRRQMRGEEAGRG